MTSPQIPGASSRSEQILQGLRNLTATPRDFSVCVELDNLSHELELIWLKAAFSNIVNCGQYQKTLQLAKLATSQFRAIEAGHRKLYPEDRIEGVFSKTDALPLILLTIGAKQYGDKFLFAIAALGEPYRDRLIKFTNDLPFPQSFKLYLSTLDSAQDEISPAELPLVGTNSNRDIVFVTTPPSRVKSYSKQKVAPASILYTSQPPKQAQRGGGVHTTGPNEQEAMHLSRDENISQSDSLSGDNDNLPQGLRDIGPLPQSLNDGPPKRSIGYENLEQGHFWREQQQNETSIWYNVQSPSLLDIGSTPGGLHSLPAVIGGQHREPVTQITASAGSGAGGNRWQDAQSLRGPSSDAQNGGSPHQVRDSDSPTLKTNRIRLDEQGNSLAPVYCVGDDTTSRIREDQSQAVRQRPLSFVTQRKRKIDIGIDDYGSSYNTWRMSGPFPNSSSAQPPSEHTAFKPRATKSSRSLQKQRTTPAAKPPQRIPVLQWQLPKPCEPLITQRSHPTPRPEKSLPSDISLNATNHDVDQQQRIGESISDTLMPERTGISSISALLNHDDNTPATALPTTQGR